MQIALRRRQFIGLLGGAAAGWPTSARAQQRPTKLPVIGIIDDAPMWNHFRQGLHELGYAEGQNIKFEYRSAGGQPQRLVAVAKSAMIGSVVNSNNPNAEPDTKDAQAATYALQRKLVVVKVRTESDFETASVTLIQQRVGALFVC
jgi:hypothetical protein